MKEALMDSLIVTDDLVLGVQDASQLQLLQILLSICKMGGASGGGQVESAVLW